MREKSFLEILSEKIEKQILADLSPGETASNYQAISTKNVDNSNEKPPQTTANNTEEGPLAQWINQIPLKKIHFQAPKNQVFGRIYPLNIPEPKPIPERKRHVLSELQKQAVVYFWGLQIKLQEDFTMQELKKAFRSLAHRLHPDRNNGKTKAFIELKAHYQCLMSVF